MSKFNQATEDRETYIVPNHYCMGKYQIIDILEDQMSFNQMAGFCKGLIIKYLMRVTPENRIRNFKKTKYYLDEWVCLMRAQEGTDVNEERIRPSYYRKGNIEIIDAIEDQLTEEELDGFYIGVIMRHICRCNYKHGLEDLVKAQYYVNRMINRELDKTNNQSNEPLNR